jgi:hypothetical protein
MAIWKQEYPLGKQGPESHSGSGKCRVCPYMPLTYRERAFVRIIFKVVFTIFIVPPAFAATDLDMKSRIHSICPSCTDQELSSQLLKLREELIDLGATKLAKTPGFYSANDPLIPSGVQLAAKSVVQIFILAKDTTLAKRFPVRLLEENLPEMKKSKDSTLNVMTKIIQSNALHLARRKTDIAPLGN